MTHHLAKAHCDTGGLFQSLEILLVILQLLHSRLVIKIARETNLDLELKKCKASTVIKLLLSY